MASTKNLAGLAALGALGYMLSKDKNQATDQTPGPGRQSLGAGYDSPGTNTGPAQTGIADADTNKSALKAIQSMPVSTPEAPNPTAGNQGVLPSKSSTPRASAPKSGKNPNYSNEGRNSIAPNYSNEGRPGVVPDMSGKLKTETTTPPQPAAKRETYRGLDGKVHYREDVAKPSVSTMRNPRTGREMTSFKKGGAAKMASGGMTSSASRRADGIAVKGKTRGKIC